MPFEVMIKFFQVSVRCDLIIMLALVNNYELQSGRSNKLDNLFFCIIISPLAVSEKVECDFKKN